MSPHAFSSLGFGFRSRARYVVRGLVFSRPAAVVARLGLSASPPGSSGSFRSPNTIACVGQACWQAVTISPSLHRPVSPSPLRSCASLMRCTQYVHFSITPRLRTVTSGFRSSCAGSCVSQSRVEEEVESPHFVRAVVRAVARADAAVVDHLVEALRAVHRRRHRAHQSRTARFRSACRCIGWKYASGIVQVALVIAIDPEPVHLAAAQHFVLADDRNVVLRLAGDVQALQPMQALRSIAMPHA